MGCIISQCYITASSKWTEIVRVMLRWRSSCKSKMYVNPLKIEDRKGCKIYYWNINHLTSYTCKIDSLKFCPRGSCLDKICIVRKQVEALWRSLILQVIISKVKIEIFVTFYAFGWKRALVWSRGLHLGIFCCTFYHLLICMHCDIEWIWMQPRAFRTGAQ